MFFLWRRWYRIELFKIIHEIRIYFFCFKFFWISSFSRQEWEFFKLFFCHSLPYFYAYPNEGGRDFSHWQEFVSLPNCIPRLNFKIIIMIITLKHIIRKAENDTCDWFAAYYMNVENFSTRYIKNGYISIYLLEKETYDISISSIYKKHFKHEWKLNASRH